MAIDLEVKHRLRDLEARIKALEDRPAYTPVISKEILDELAKLEALNRRETKTEGRALCPHCGIKPNHFFHVRSCAAKNSRAGG